MRGTKARKLRKEVYGDMSQKTADYVATRKAVTVFDGRALDKDGKRSRDKHGRALSMVRKVLSLFPKKGETSVRAGVLRTKYQKAKIQHKRRLQAYYVFDY